MKAIVCVDYGLPSRLVLQELPAAVPGPKQVAITNYCAGVNFPDTLLIQGKYQVRPEPPFSPGSELAGIVKEVGAEVHGFAPGDKVIALTPFGAYAQEVIVQADRLIMLPADTSPAVLEAAGCFTMTYGTSYHALANRAHPRPGETLLVLGASGGVGLAAVELGKLLGLRVIAAASTPDKLGIARQAGADELIDYERDDLRERIKALTNGRGVDIVYDPVGGKLAEPALRSVGWNGRYLVVGFAGGEIPRIPLNLPLLKGSSIVGVFWGEFTRREPETHRDNMRQLISWLATGRIRPLISARYPLSKAPDALDAILGRRVVGKSVILPQQLD